MSNLRSVIRFEVWRSLKKKSFWYATIAIPVIIILIFVVDYASSNHANKASQQQTQSYSKNSKLAVFDQTGLINKQLLSGQHIIIEPSKQAGITAVTNKSLTAFFYYPKDVSKAGIQVYAQDQGISFSPPYNTVAIQLLKQSVVDIVGTVTHNNQAVNILQKDPNVTAIAYKNGKPTKGLATIDCARTIWHNIFSPIYNAVLFTMPRLRKKKIGWPRYY